MAFAFKDVVDRRACMRDLHERETLGVLTGRAKGPVGHNKRSDFLGHLGKLSAQGSADCHVDWISLSQLFVGGDVAAWNIYAFQKWLITTRGTIC